MPSEIVKQHVFFTFEVEEEGGFRRAPEVGLDNFLWASDFPGLDSPWPDSKAMGQCAGRARLEKRRSTAGLRECGETVQDPGDAAAIAANTARGWIKIRPAQSQWERISRPIKAVIKLSPAASMMPIVRSAGAKAFHRRHQALFEGREVAFGPLFEAGEVRPQPRDISPERRNIALRGDVLHD